MAVYRSEFVTDIAKPFAVRPIAHQMAAGDADAYEFTVLVADSRAPETGLMAGSVSGAVVRPDGGTVVITGEKGTDVRTVQLPEGECNATPCTITIPQAALAYPGRVVIVIRLLNDTVETTVLAASATVARTLTGTVIDPGEAVPDITALLAQIQACKDATDAAEAVSETTLGNFAQEFDAAEPYAAGAFVTYAEDGKLYLLPEGHTAGTSWANTTHTETDFGAEVSDLKSQIVIQQATQPTEANNRIWFPSATPEGVEVPTWAEHQELKSAISPSVENNIIKAVNETNLVYSAGAQSNVVNLKAQQVAVYSAKLDYVGFGFVPSAGAQAYAFSPPFVSGKKYKLYVHYYGDYVAGQSYSNIRVYRGNDLVNGINIYGAGEQTGTGEFTSDGTEKLRIYVFNKDVFKLYSAIAVEEVSTLSSQFTTLLNAAIGTNLKYMGHITSANYNTLIPDLNNAVVNTYYTGYTADSTKLPTNVPVITNYPFTVETYGTNGYLVFQKFTLYNSAVSIADNAIGGTSWTRLLSGLVGSRSVFTDWVSVDSIQNTQINAIAHQVRPVVTVNKTATADEEHLLYNNFYKAMKYAYTNSCDVYVCSGNYDLVAEYIAVEGQAAYDAINNAWKGTPIGHGMTVKCAAEAYFTMKNTASTSANYLTIGQWLAPLLPLDGGFRLEGWNIDAKNTRYVVHDGGYNNSDVFCNHEFINCQMKLDNTDFEGQSGLQTYKQCIGGGLLSGGIHVIVKDCIFESENVADNAGIVSYHNVSDTAEGATSYNTYEISGCYFRSGTARCTYHGTETPVSPFKLHDNLLRANPLFGAEASGDTVVNMELLAWNNTIQASN